MEIKIKKPKFKNVFEFFVHIGSNTVSQVFVLFILLIAINLISQNFFFRIDLTKTKTYTLSSGTKNILDSIEDNVTITTYFSDNLPPDVLPIIQDTKDIFDEYARFSNGKVTIEHKNPDDENFKTEATADGIPEIQFSELTSDKFEIATGFIGAAIKYKEETEAIELITDVTDLEYITSSRIYKLISEEKPKIGFLTGHSEKSTVSELTAITELLESQFEIEQVDLSEGEVINPDEIKILIIIAPTGSLSERDKFEIDQYIMRGGKLIVLTDQYVLDYQDPVLVKNEYDINEFLSHYGVEASQSVILDESYLPLQSGYIQIRYPFWVLVLNENVNSENPAVNKLESTVFFWANPLDDKTDGERKFTPLLQTTKQAWLKTGESISAEPTSFEASNYDQYTLAALIEGPQESMFKDQDIPALDDEEAQDKRTSDDPRVDEVEDSKIVVIGDSDFIADSFIEGSEQNPVFFNNLIEWLAGSDDLIEIRSKNIERRPLDVSEQSTKTFYKIADISFAPILLIISGVGYNIYRKKRKNLL